MISKKTKEQSLNQIVSNLYSLSGLNNQEALLVGISGIDAAGKGFISGQIKDKLEKKGLKVALVSIDDWHQPKNFRLIKPYGAFNFYATGFRFDELFDKLILPLKKYRSVNILEDLVHATEDVHYKKQFFFEEIDVILLEGIFIFKKEFQHHYDYKIWVGCDYKTALERSKKRNQEKQDLNILERDYLNIYFPAQEIHIQRDNVKNQVNTIFINCIGGENILQ
jgi:uridine kinase